MKITDTLTAHKKIRWNHEKGAFDTVLVSGVVTLEINVEGILRELGTKALLNKTGKAREFGGLVTATVTRRTENPLASPTNPPGDQH